MARTFSTARYEYGTTIPTPANCTVACWVTTGNVTGTKSIVDRDDGANRYFQFRMSGNKLQFIGFSSNSPATATGATALSATTTYHVAGRADGSAVKCYVNGTEDGTAALGAMDNDTVRFHVGNGAGDWDGMICEIAQWNVALDTAELGALADGFSPLLIRPTALQIYVPMIGRYSAEPSLIGGYTGTLFGTANVSDHPRIITPRPARVHPLIAVGGGSPANIPEMMAYYRRLRAA